MCIRCLVGVPGGRLGVRPRPFVWEAGVGSPLRTLGRLPVPSSLATTKRPTRMIIGVVVFAVGVLAGALIAAWVVPPA